MTKLIVACRIFRSSLMRLNIIWIPSLVKNAITITEIILVFSQKERINKTEKSSCQKLFLADDPKSVLCGSSPGNPTLPAMTNRFSYQIQADTNFRKPSLQNTLRPIRAGINKATHREKKKGGAILRVRLGHQTTAVRCLTWADSSKVSGTII